MIQVILGSKGSGKTLKLIDMANKAVGEERGNIFYIDFSGGSMPIFIYKNSSNKGSLLFFYKCM